MTFDVLERANNNMFREINLIILINTGNHYICECWNYRICAKCTEEYGEEYAIENIGECRHSNILLHEHGIFIFIILISLHLPLLFRATSDICYLYLPISYPVFHRYKSFENYRAVYDQENNYGLFTISVLIYILCGCMFATFYYHKTFALK